MSPEYQESDISDADFDGMEVVAVLGITSDLVRSVMKCPRCGQLYFCENLEWPTYGNRDLSSDYTTLIPVSYDPELIKDLAEGDFWNTLRYTPRLQVDEGKETIWVKATKSS